MNPLAHPRYPQIAAPDSDAGTAAQLAGLLEGYREELMAAWVTLLCGLDGSHYREHLITDLQLSSRSCINALAAFFRTGSTDELSRYSEGICKERADQGFDISEIIEGHLMLNEAVLPVIQRECQWDAEEETALKMAALLDAALRWLVIRFSKLYSLTLNRMLQDQVTLLETQQAQLERRVREVSALVKSSTLITSMRNLDSLLTLILEQLAEVVQYDRASIMMLFDRRLRIIAGRGFRRPDEIVGVTFDPGQNALTRRMLEGEGPVVLQDVTNEPGFVADRDDPTRSWIGVPLMVRSETIGALALDTDQPGFYDEQDGQTVLAFANQAAVAIENARLYDRSREQDILQERNRLARELHDSLSQSLFSMVLNAEAANLFFDAEPQKAREQISLLYETANAALKDMRTLIFELRPADLEQEGLAAVLTKHAKLVGDRHGLRISVDVKGQRRLPLNIEKALFRIAQEALNNVVKHANATEAWVTLTSQDNWVYMNVRDNGVGIQPGTSKPNTLGLVSMSERAAQIGGEIYIGPWPEGQGTEVRVKVPCDR
ncbi:MAG TPA: GAF domain-containing sensor histidine kinase [Chloroflexia bacterium]|nr:GAF domain-containing sensor histidine kinase [Chloroflexia bacterium]